MSARDRKIIDFLSKAKYATIPQLAELFFKTVIDDKQRLKKANERMKALCDQGILFRSRLPGDYYIYSLQPFVYYAGIQRYLELVDELIKVSNQAEGKLIWEIDGGKADLWAKDNKQVYLINLGAD